MISLVGPKLSFTDAIFINIFVVQHFTETIELNGDPFQADKIIYVAHFSNYSKLQSKT